MDTLVLNAITQELREQICPSRINTISQPDEYSVAFSLWNQRRESRLVISVDSRYQYLFLSKTPPKKTPILNFGKFLQHHIKGGDIHALSKPLLERILTFDIVKKDIDGQELRFQLVLEIMGRHSNLILLQTDTGKILESVRHVTAVQSSYRRIAPGAVYVPPPPQEKRDLTTIERPQFQSLLERYAAKSGQQLLWKFLLQHIQGISPVLAKEIAGAGQMNTSEETRWNRLARIIDVVATGRYQPTVVLQSSTEGGDKPLVLSALLLEQYAGRTDLIITSADSMNAAAEQYYGQLIERQHYDVLQQSLLGPISHRLAKLHKKREHLRVQQEQIEYAEEYKKQGELITANIYQLTKGMRTARVIDYYQEGQPEIDIALDPRLTPSQNAQRYFKRYNKLKQGQSVAEQRLRETEQEIAYQEERKFFIEEAAALQDLQGLRDEIQDVESPARKKRAAKQMPAEPKQPFLRRVSSDGFPIYIGRSSRENDLLTQRTAQPQDTWLHVYQAPGSHVVILNRERKADIPERTLLEAASLAAYHSKLRHSGKVDVIYTLKKYVKKPKGSPPGLVTLSQFQTIRVAPRAGIELQG